MNFEFTEDQRRFRDDLRSFLDIEVPLDRQEVFGIETEEQYQYGRSVARKLAARGGSPSDGPKSTVGEAAAR